MGQPRTAALFETDETDDEGNGIDIFIRELEWIVLLIIRDDEDMILVAAWLYALDDSTLCGVEDIGLVPLEEDIGHRNTLASDDIARYISRCHAVSLDRHKEVGIMEGWYHVSLALVF